MTASLGGFLFIKNIKISNLVNLALTNYKITRHSVKFTNMSKTGVLFNRAKNHLSKIDT